MKDVYCPFCQSENPVLAELCKEQILKNYDKELQRMRNTEPDKAIRKWTWRLIAGCGILAGVALLAGIVLAICAPIKARWDYQRHQLHEQKLEEMFAEKDIKGIYRYISDKRLYGSDFPKFGEIYSAYLSYTLYQSYVEKLEEYKEDSYRDRYDESGMRAETEKTCRKLIEYACEGLQLCRQYCHDSIFYGNEALLEGYYEEICEELRRLGVSDRELDWMSRKQENAEDSQLQQIADLIADVYMRYYYPASE